MDTYSFELDQTSLKVAVKPSALLPKRSIAAPLSTSDCTQSVRVYKGYNVGKKVR